MTKMRGSRCHKCGILVDTDTLILKNFLIKDVERMSMYHSGAPVRVGEYDNYYVVWLCPDCESINLNCSLNNEVITLIPKFNNNGVYGKLLNCEDDDLKKLFDDFNTCLQIGLTSPAVLVARKILMHLAVSETNCDTNLKFVDYINELDKSGILGKKWKDKLELLRRLGNEENHEIKIASIDDADLVNEIIVGLIDNIYL
jgi:hypothetical protein